MNKNKVYKAFANEQRLNLLRCLSRPKNVTDLLENCSLTQSALSQHLKVLRDSELVQTRKQGKQIIYSVGNKKITEVTNLLLKLK